MLYDDLRDPVALLRGETRTRLSQFWPYAEGREDDVEAAAAYSALMAQSQKLIAEETVDAEGFESLFTDLPPKQVMDTTVEGQRAIFDSMRPALLAPLLGLPGLAVPVGRSGKLRTGVQILAMRNREDLTLDAGEVIEAAEGVVKPVDPAT